MTKHVSVVTANSVGAIVTELFYITSIFSFISVLTGYVTIGLYVRLTQILFIIPLYWMLATASRFESPFVYYVQITSLMVYLPIQLIKVIMFDIGKTTWRWADLTHLAFLFIASGCMLGVASYGGQKWKAITVSTFFIMALIAVIELIIS